jgi:hypothetical protein
MGRWLKYGLIGCGALSVLGVLLVGFVVAVALLTNSETADSGGGSDGAAQEKEPISCEVDKVCELGESTVTVTKFEDTDLLVTKTEKHKGDFVVVEFDYTYGGDKPAQAGDYRWKLEDGRGRTYNHFFDRTLVYEVDFDRTLLYTKVNPGVENEGAIVFETAPDAKDFTLHVEDLIRPAANKKANVPL